MASNWTHLSQYGNAFSEAQVIATLLTSLADVQDMQWAHLQVGAPSPSQGEEEDLIKDGNEAAPVSLADTYRGIMAGVGLAGSALEAWLEHWMKLLTAEVAEMAQGGIANTIPGSRAAELLVESRLSRAVAAIAGKYLPRELCLIGNAVACTRRSTCLLYRTCTSGDACTVSDT